jgi:hypothetical protein
MPKEPGRGRPSGGPPKRPMSSEVSSCVREKENKMIIKNNNGPSEPLPPRTAALPLAPDGADRPSAGPRKMLDEKKCSRSYPSRAPRFSEWRRQARFRKGPTSRRTEKFGTKMRLSRGKIRWTNTTRTDAGAKGAGRVFRLTRRVGAKEGSNWLMTTEKWQPCDWDPVPCEYRLNGNPYIVCIGLNGHPRWPRWIVRGRNGLPLRDARGCIRHYSTPEAAVFRAETQQLLKPNLRLIEP